MSDDWRLQGQERFLKGVTLCRKKYTPYRDDWDHDHCAFCGKKFSEQQDDAHEGFATEDSYHWVCDVCFADFRQRFGWTLRETT